MNKNSVWFYILTFLIFLILISPTFLSQGMFFDGTIYSTIANNFASNNWNFWKPHYTNTFNDVFYGHPPLSMWLHSKLLLFFGNYLFIDKFYSVLTIILTSFVIFLISKVLEIKNNWLPMLLWLVNPLVFWAATNNVLENLLSFFVALSMLFFVLSTKKYSFLMLFLSGFTIFLGVLTKGFVALFPLSIPFFYFIVSKEKKFWYTMLQTFVIFISILTPIVILYFFCPQAQKFMQNYIKIQFLGSFSVVTANSRFDIIQSVFLNLLPFIIISFFLYLMKKIKKFETKIEWNSALLVLFVALSGTLPIMVTLKQSQMYIIPSMPFYSLFFAFIFEAYLSKIKIRIKLIKIFSLFFLFLAICSNFYFSNKIGRDKDLLVQVNQIIDKIPKDSTISATYNVFSNWTLNAYLARYKNISLDATKDASHKFSLFDKTTNIDSSFYNTLIETKDYFFVEKK